MNRADQVDDLVVRSLASVVIRLMAAVESVGTAARPPRCFRRAIGIAWSSASEASWWVSRHKPRPTQAGWVGFSSGDLALPPQVQVGVLPGACLFLHTPCLRRWCGTRALSQIEVAEVAAGLCGVQSRAIVLYRLRISLVHLGHCSCRLVHGVLVTARSSFRSFRSSFGGLYCRRGSTWSMMHLLVPPTSPPLPPGWVGKPGLPKAASRYGVLARDPVSLNAYVAGYSGQLYTSSQS